MAITPRTINWRTAGGNIINRVVVTSLPQPLGIPNAGNFEVDVGDGVWRPRTIVQNIVTVPYARQITATLPSYAINLNTVRALPVGVTATYAGPTLPAQGVTLSGSTLTLFPPSGGGAGTYTVRSTRSDGVLEDLVLTLTIVALAVSVTAQGAVTITQGADDPADTPMSATITAEAGTDAAVWDGAVLNWTPGQLSQTTAFWGVVPVVAISSGAGAGGTVTVGGVLTRSRPGLRLYRAGGTPAAVLGQWHDAGGAIPGATNPASLTVASGMVSPLRWVESDGGPNTGSSNTIAMQASTALGVNFVAEFTWAQGAFDGPTRFWNVPNLVAGRTYLVIPFARRGSVITQGAATLAGQPASVVTAGANVAAAPAIGDSSVAHLAAFTATPATSGTGAFRWTTTSAELPNDGHLSVYEITGPFTPHAVSAAGDNSLAAPWQVTRDVATVQGGAVFVAARTSTTTANTFDNSTGFTVVRNAVVSPGETVMTGTATNVPAATLRQVRIGSLSQASGSNTRTIAISFAPA